MSRSIENAAVSVRIVAESFEFLAQFEDKSAPQTCANFRSLMPYRQKIIHVRWSGEACWIPLGDVDFKVKQENLTSYPAPGQILLYPGGISETEILIAYGGVRFASKVGQLAGNHFLTIVSGMERISEFGRYVLWHGALDIVFEPYKGKAKA